MRVPTRLSSASNKPDRVVEMSFRERIVWKLYTLSKTPVYHVLFKAKIVKAKRRKKLLHGNKLRYWSSDPLVATVSTGGQIKAVGAGNCTVWICVMNG